MRLIDADALLAEIDTFMSPKNIITALAINIARRWIESAPTIEIEQKWVSVEERLPEPREETND